jgi:hypothetical protein
MPRRSRHGELGVDRLLAMGESQRTCGTCKHISDPSEPGTCEILMTGSDIAVDPPLFLLQGAMNFQTEPRMDASKCKYYEGRTGISFSC